MPGRLGQEAIPRAVTRGAATGAGGEGAGAREAEAKGRDAPLKIYVASSWRNEFQPSVVCALRGHGFEVYDFRNPREGDNGFHWSEIDPDWKRWTPEQYRRCLSDPVAEDGFRKDFAAMQWAETFVLLCPCGRSAHLELGWAIGAGKKTIIWLAPGEPELMYKMVDAICVNYQEVLGALEKR